MTTPRKPRRPPRPRPKTRAELLAREKEVWDELAATWCKLPDAALAQPGACGPGWSVKDVMNHVAAWQEAALRIIPQLLVGQRATLGAGTDRFNAQQQAADRDRSVAASKRRLNQSRRDLLALLDQIPDAPLLDQNSRVNWWVRYTLHAHYGEHLWELEQFRKEVLNPPPPPRPVSASAAASDSPPRSPPQSAPTPPAGASRRVPSGR